MVSEDRGFLIAPKGFPKVANQPDFDKNDMLEVSSSSLLVNHGDLPNEIQ